MALTDELTGIFYRRQLLAAAEREFRRARRANHTLSLLMVDIDHFKQANDIDGHLVGDQVLRAVAELFTRTVREVDLVGRYGGEESMLVLPDAGARQCRLPSACAASCPSIQCPPANAVFRGT